MLLDQHNALAESGGGGCDREAAGAGTDDTEIGRQRFGLLGRHCGIGCVLRHVRPRMRFWKTGSNA